MFTCESPFQLGRRVRKGTYKTLMLGTGTMASPSEKAIITLRIPSLQLGVGAWYSSWVPRGFVSSGNSCNYPLGVILSDVKCKAGFVNNTIHYNADMGEHRWHTIDFLIRYNYGPLWDSLQPRQVPLCPQKH